MPKAKKKQAPTPKIEKTPYQKALQSLTVQRRVFVEAVIETLNPSEAARRAKYGSPRVKASELLRYPQIKAVLELGFVESYMAKEEIVARQSDIARADMGDFYTLEPTVITQKYQKPVIELLEETRRIVAYHQGEVSGSNISVVELEAHEDELKKVRKLEIFYRQRLIANPDALATLEREVQVMMPRLDLEKAEKHGKTHVIREMKWVKGEPQLKLRDADAAQERLGRFYSLWDKLKNADESALEPSEIEIVDA